MAQTKDIAKFADISNGVFNSITANSTAITSIVAQAFTFANGVSVNAATVKFRKLIILNRFGGSSLVDSEASLLIKPHTGNDIAVTVPASINYITVTKHDNITTYIPIN